MPSAQRTARIAFLALFFVLTAQGLLQTARDSLFLAKLPSSSLPYVYVLVAFLTLLVSRLQRWSGRGGLLPTLSMASLGTALLWVALPIGGVPILYAVYAWAGVVGSLLTIQFWSTLSGSMTMTEARQHFGFIGSGATFGALAGNATAAVLTQWLPSHLLLLGVAAVFALALAPTYWMVRSTAGRSVSKPAKARITKPLREILSPYVLVVGSMVLIGSVCLTIVDWQFKSWMSDTYAPDQLGQSFATAYLVFNLLGLFVQLFVVQRVLRGPGVGAGLAPLPALVTTTSVIGALGFPVVGALGAQLAAGSLKHTLSKTSRELLFVPMASHVRAQVKDIR